MTILWHFIASFFSTMAFGIITNIPRRVLVSSGITGGLGWLTYTFFQSQGFGIGISNFSATFVIGCFSIFFSRRKKVPMIIFNIPSLVPLVPGGPAYQAVRELVLGDNLAAFNQIVIVIITAGSIASAFMMTSLVERVLKKIHLSSKKKS